MDGLSWIWWGLTQIASGVLGLFWLLIGGWVSALLQIAVLVFAIYYMKYGWRRAPVELWKRTHAAGRFFWNWVRAKEPDGQVRIEEREVVRFVHTKDFGDINVSTLMSLFALGGVLAVSML